VRKDIPIHDNYSWNLAGMPRAPVFIDGDRADETVAADIRGVSKIGARVICSHDYDGDRFPGIVRAVDEGGGAVRRVGTL
jgi:hypothetical protein